MTLPLYEPRCQGRQVNHLGTGTLCIECVDCDRRTDIPAEVKLTFMLPPKFYRWGCPEYVAPGAELVELGS